MEMVFIGILQGWLDEHVLRAVMNSAVRRTIRGTAVSPGSEQL